MNRVFFPTLLGNSIIFSREAGRIMIDLENGKKKLVYPNETLLAFVQAPRDRAFLC